MINRSKPLVVINGDGSVAQRYPSTYACQKDGLCRSKILASCNTGILYRGLRWMWEEDYQQTAKKQGVEGLRYESAVKSPLPRRRIAFTYDYRGDNDDQLVFLFKGATESILHEVFKIICSGEYRIARNYELREGHDVVRLWRHQYDRLEVWLEDSDLTYISLYDVVTLIAARLRGMVSGDVDFYLIDDWLNLTDRDMEAIQKAWDTFHPSKKPRKKKKLNEITKEEENKPMPKMYVRVPGYVAGFFRGRNEDRQLNEFEAYEFPDHDDLTLFMEHHLRLIPEQNQCALCLSERAFSHILHGKQPGGNKQIINRNPNEWPTAKELCTLTGKYVTDKQESSDYLCIAIPKEILDNGRLHRTNGSYALSKKEAEKFVAYLRQEFKREFLAFCEVDEMTCLENGLNRSDVDRMERFFANYNMPISVDQKDRESLRKLLFRMRKQKNIKPYLRRQLGSFAEHISQEDIDKAERWAKKKEIVKRRAKNES